MDGVTPLIQSIPNKIINGRYVIKASMFDDGIHPKSIVLVVDDLLTSGFSVKYFKDEPSVAAFLKILSEATE